MKKITFILLSCISLGALAQKDNVGIGTTKPDPSAALEINSSNKGLLMPRLSLQQRNTIQSPAKGLIVYQTDMLSGFYFYDGEKWQPLTSNTSENSVAADPNDWTMAGNSVAAGAFLGTTNNQPLLFRMNNIHAGRITALNTFLGSTAGNNTTTTYDLVAIGNDALKNVTTGFENTAVGKAALRDNTGGASNTALGVRTLQGNTTGSQNVAIGGRALLANTTGNFNMGIGTNTLAANTTGIRNIGIGISVLSSSTGNDNIGIGTNSMFSKTSGNNNVGIGSNALSGNLTGSGNVAIGHDAGRNETGSNRLYIANSNTSNPLIKGEFDNKNLKINTGSTVSSTVGFLAVGNFDAAYTMPASNSYRLIVQDGIITEKVKVALKSTADWADYVFEPNYKLMSIESIEAFTKANKHLPNVPSAEEMATSGLDVTMTSKMFMEKIEELTLHIIELNKRIKELEKNK